MIYKSLFSTIAKSLAARKRDIRDRIILNRLLAYVIHPDDRLNEWSMRAINKHILFDYKTEKQTKLKTQKHKKQNIPIKKKEEEKQASNAKK